MDDLGQFTEAKAAGAAHEAAPHRNHASLPSLIHHEPNQDATT